MDRAAYTEDEVTLLHLPARLGGVGQAHLASLVSNELEASRMLTEIQVKELVQQNADHEVPTLSTVYRVASQAWNSIKQHRSLKEAEQRKRLAINSSIRGRILELLSQKGTSALLTVLPLKEHGFLLSK